MASDSWLLGIGPNCIGLVLILQQQCFGWVKGGARFLALGCLSTLCQSFSKETTTPIVWLDEGRGPIPGFGVAVQIV